MRPEPDHVATLGGNGKNRLARKDAKEMMLLLRPK